MIRWNRVVVVCASTLLIAACGDSRSSPVGPELEVRRSGGYLTGGNVTQADTTYATQTGGGEQLQTDGTDDGATRDGGFTTGGN